MDFTPQSVFFAAAGDEGGYFIIALLILFVGAVWFFFPFLILGKCNKMIDELKQITARMIQSEGHLREMRKYFEPPPPPLPQLDAPERESIRRN